MSLREAATIWMSSRAMKKPTHMTAKAKIFLPSESSAMPGAAVAGGSGASAAGVRACDGRVRVAMLA
jgi:hypothetical protein